ncbi:MAG: MarR family transcriptional regulator [Planctomycetes bacterium]|nr:MarR family transcriptional regulator [Planctomycetota bacterium]
MPAASSHIDFNEPPIDDPSQRRLPPQLRRAWYSLNQAFRRRLAPLNLTPDQFTVLRWLHERASESLTQRRLADLMASDPNTVTSVLNRMESAGLIERKAHASDRRAKQVSLKPKGLAAYTQARKIAVDLQSQILSVIPMSQRARFLEQLE